MIRIWKNELQYFTTWVIVYITTWWNSISWFYRKFIWLFIIIIIKILYQILLQQAAQPSHRNIWKVGYNKTCTLSTLFGYISGYKTGYIHFYSKNIKNDKDIKKINFNSPYLLITFLKVFKVDYWLVLFMVY